MSNFVSSISGRSAGRGGGEVKREEAAGSDAASRRARATFYTSGMEHSPTSATGTGWEPTPWHATQRAAWEALREAE